MIVVLALIGCSSPLSDAMAPTSSTAEQNIGFGYGGEAPTEPMEDAPGMVFDEEEEDGEVREKERGKDDKPDDGILGSSGKKRLAQKPKVSNAEPEPGGDARIRQWFPEAFLWQPLVETNGDGVASVDVRVPDQLTTWRVLALAHDRAGHQSGAVHTFDSALPVAVDPVLPGWLYTGDELSVPTQVQAMDAPFEGRVTMSADGALQGAGGGAVSLSVGGSAVVSAPFSAVRSGRGTLRAEIFAGARVDGAERVVQVRPTGRPVVTQRGGVLSGPRTFTLDVADASEQRTVVTAFPGPLAMLHAELDRVGEAPPGAYGFALLSGVETLSAVSGVEVKAGQLRTLRIRSWQRLIRAARNPDALTASQLLHGLHSPPDTLSETLRDRLVRTVVQGQRGDGTWSRDARATLQAVLVQTAMATRMLPEKESGARLRASGALERNLPMVDDPYTAAWMLISGEISLDQRAMLQEIVLEGISEVEGRYIVTMPDKARDPLGQRPTRAQLLAVTSLALADRDDLAWRGDLVSELLQGWSAERGFGAGWADTLALEAVTKGLATLDQSVAIVVERDGVEISRGALDPKQPHVPVHLEAVGGGKLTVRAEPPVPGLAFVATHTAWVPFTGREALPGVEVEVSLSRLVAGQTGTMTLSAAGPSGSNLEIVQGVPAGTTVEVPAGTRALLSQPPKIEQDRVVLTLKPFGAGEVKELVLEVTPTFAGRMRTRALELSVGRQRVHLGPAVWTVSAGGGA